MSKVSQESVNYRPATGAKHCGNCVMYHDHVCTLVDGNIEPDHVCDRWESKVEDKKVDAVAVAAVCMQARSLDIRTDDDHPNKMPFSGILTRIDEPSDAAPDGSNGARVMITAEAARKALDSLLGMAVDYVPNFDGHDPQAKIGCITGAEIVGNAIHVKGFIYRADFPEVAKQIKDNKDVLGMSFEARDLWTNDPTADPLPIFDCKFTGAAILLRDKAAYKTTSISAQAETVEDFSMTIDEFKQQMADALKPVTESLAQVGEAVKAQAEKLVELEKAQQVSAANHLGKIEPHAKRLEDAADKMDEDGIGGHDTRGHAAVLRHMAGAMRADAAEGKMPHVYHQDGGFYASAAKDTAAVEAKVAEVKAQAEAEFTKKLAEVKAEAEKVQKELADKVASAETMISDVKAKAEKAVADAGNKPARKTLAPQQIKLLAKAGVEMPTDDSKLSVEKLDKAFAEAHLTTDQRFQLKTALAHVGAIA